MLFSLFDSLYLSFFKIERLKILVRSFKPQGNFIPNLSFYLLISLSIYNYTDLFKKSFTFIQLFLNYFISIWLIEFNLYNFPIIKLSLVIMISISLVLGLCKWYIFTLTSETTWYLEHPDIKTNIIKLILFN